MIGSLIDTWNASVQKLQPGHCCQIHNWFQTRIYSYQSILEQSRITLLLSWHLDIKRRSGKKKSQNCTWGNATSFLHNVLTDRESTTKNEIYFVTVKS